MIDGSEHSPETTLDANYHLIQILDPKGAVYSSQFEHLQSDRLITISPPPNVKRPLLAVSLGGIIVLPLPLLWRYSKIPIWNDRPL